MVKIVILTAMHERPLVSELFAISVNRLIERNKHKYDVSVVALVSDKESEAVCKNYGIDIIQTVKHPLGTKMNAGMDILIQKTAFDYLLLFGDDDIMSPELLTCYEDAITRKVPYFGVNQIYFLDAVKQRAILFRYESHTKLMGCGRMFSREALMRTGYQCTVTPNRTATILGIELRKRIPITIPCYQAEYMIAMNYASWQMPKHFRLYRDDQINGLDFQSEMSMVFNGYFPEVIYTDLPMITDVKTGVNIWSYEELMSFGTSVPVADAMQFWGEKELNHYQKNYKS